MRLSLFRVLAFVLLGGLAQSAAAFEMPVVTPLADGLKNPESVAVGVATVDGKAKFTIVVSEIGEFGTDGDGKITILEGAKKISLAEGLDDPKGIVFVGEQLFVTDKNRVWRIGPKGGKEVFAAAEAFPVAPNFLNDIEADSAGNLYVSDTGEFKDGKPAGTGGAVYKITPDGKVTTILDNTKVKAPNGLLLDGDDALLVADFFSGDLNRLNLKEGTQKKIAEGLEGGDGLVFDFDGNLYVTQWSKGVLSILRDGKGPAVPYGPKFQASADHCLNPKTGQLLIPDMKAGTIVGVSIVSAAPTDIDASPLTSVRFEPAFTQIEEIERPIILTHGNDGTGRTFIASQKGNIYVLDKPDAEPRLFFDFQSHVSYKDNENEEGFLGLAFHPQFKTNGQFFVFYTKKEGAPHTSVISRFTANKETVQTADAKTEEEIISIPQPFWNHNGGTIAFGPDGKLYVGLGDGGAADDPMENGQNLSTINGSILRLDIDAKDPGLGYAIPKDNPFVGQAGARGEIWAYGIRNIWRLAFDGKTGTLWAADVGQNIWEEINLIVKGGNYGWNKREGMHKFRANGSGPKPEFIEPIWEYHHDIGRSITGGHVYRGKKIPQLDGWYLYADYIRGTVWALQYDEASKKLLANREISGQYGDGKTVSNIIPVVSFGEDESGETYFLTNGNRFFRIVNAQ